MIEQWIKTIENLLGLDYSRGPGILVTMFQRPRRRFEPPHRPTETRLMIRTPLVLKSPQMSVHAMMPSTLGYSHCYLRELACQMRGRGAKKWCHTAPAIMSSDAVWRGEPTFKNPVPQPSGTGLFSPPFALQWRGIWVRRRDETS